MFGGNQWGGTFEISGDSATDVDEQSRQLADMERASLSRPTLDETQQSWLLGYGEQKKKKRYVDLGCIVISTRMFKWIVGIFISCALFAGLVVLIDKTLPKHHHGPLPPDKYTVALHKALMFFNEQKSGHLTKANNVSWRGDSGMQDGLVNNSATPVNLVGGYYDAGHQIKFGFPGAFAMTMLSWSVIEYSPKYQAIGELNHVKGLIRWGTDYILKTFNSSAKSIDFINCQVGTGLNNSNTPNDRYCWMRPEDMDYARRVIQCYVGSDLAAEMAAALSAASIVFKDDMNYSKKLVQGATLLFAFARNGGKRGRYSQGQPEISQYYNSTGYYDEYVWGGAWMYLATGNSSYLQLVTTLGIAQKAGTYSTKPSYGVFSWDNKLPGAEVLLSRIRIFLGPGYPYEDLLNNYQTHTANVMCSYLPYFKSFNRTKGGLIELNHGNPPSLQYVVNAAFLATLYSDYMAAADIPGWYCGPNYFTIQDLRNFATTQMNYILGQNPMNMSYVVGYGNRYPKHVHHRAASIPENGVKYSCTGGYKWRDSPNPNPHVLTGAMVAGPDKFDGFHDVRGNVNYTEPTIAGNAGLVAALIALTEGDNGVVGIDKNSIFSAVPPMFPMSPPPPPPWIP